MLSDRDIWTSANLMIKRYREDAAAEAAKRAEELSSEGDVDGQQAWLRIAKAIAWLQAPGPDETTPH